MGGGAVVDIKRDAQGNIVTYNFRMNKTMVLSAILIALGGLCVGFDNGLTGGIESMPAFLKQFYGDVYEQKQHFAKTDPYCSFDNQLLQFYTSVAYIGGLVGGPISGIITKRYGRRMTVFIGGIIYLIGCILQTAAFETSQLIVGRFILGLGAGLVNAVCAVYLCEIAPTQYRGAFTLSYQWLIAWGQFLCTLINFGVAKYELHGYRISLGIQGVPSLIICAVIFFIPESPNFYFDQSKVDQGIAALQKYRGVKDVDSEANDITAAAERGRLSKMNAYRSFFHPKNAPQATISMLLPIFNQLTGINVIMFYAPQIMITLGMSNSGALGINILLAFCHAAGYAVSFALVDKVGRKSLLIEGGIQMFASHIIYAGLIGKFFHPGFDSRAIRGVLIFLSCFYIVGFAWGWGAVSWVMGNEILKLELRPAGGGIFSTNVFLFCFVVGQTFLSMYCHLKYFTYVLFGGLCLVMTIFVAFFTVETKGVPLERVNDLFKRHWFWKRIVNRYEDNISIEEYEVQRAKSQSFAQIISQGA